MINVLFYLKINFLSVLLTDEKVKIKFHIVSYMLPHLIGILLLYAFHKTMSKATDVLIDKAIDLTSNELISIATMIKDGTIKYITHETAKPEEKHETVEDGTETDPIETIDDLQN